MKITILTTAIFMSAVFGINQPTFASARNTEEIRHASNVASEINKIEIHGNVELYISGGITGQVKVYNDDYKGEIAPDQNGVLRISSYQKQKLVVWVTVCDINNISAYDNAEVKSFGALSAIDLYVKLYNNASARLNMDVYKANITLNDHAKADLEGNANEVELKCDQSSSVDITNLASDHIVKTETRNRMAIYNL
jgi:hypothetical protein